jgi:phospholipid/cholesterol/gamma-HCH transport system substrate-binding protein
VILLVVIGALIIAFFLYVMYARGVFEPTQQLVLVTDNSEGVIPGMDMSFAGFPIGRVRQVDLGQDGKVNILVDVPKVRRQVAAHHQRLHARAQRGRRDPLRAYSGILTDPPLPDKAQRPCCAATPPPRFPRLLATARTLLDNLEAMTRPIRAVGNTPDQRRDADRPPDRPLRPAGHGALGGDEEAKKLLQTLQRVDALLAKTDQRVFGKKGVMDDAQARSGAERRAEGCARARCRRSTRCWSKPRRSAPMRASRPRTWALRGEVDASLRKVNRLVDEINRKWPFKRDEEIKLP